MNIIKELSAKAKIITNILVALGSVTASVAASTFAPRILPNIFPPGGGTNLEEVQKIIEEKLKDYPTDDLVKTADFENLKNDYEKKMTVLENAALDEQVPSTPPTPLTAKIQISVKEEFQNKLETLKNEIIEQMERDAQVKPAPSVNSEQIKLINEKLENLYRLLKAGATTAETPVKFDLKKLGYNILKRNLFKETDLKLDYEGGEITGEILNEVFKNVLNKPKGSTGVVEKYEFPYQARDEDFTISEWIETEEQWKSLMEEENKKPNPKLRPRRSVFDLKKRDSKGKETKESLAGWPKDNAFDTGNPQQLNNEYDFRTKKRELANYTQMALKTGGGKSTFIPRCLAFRRLSNDEYKKLQQEEEEKIKTNPNFKRKKFGVSLVFPYSSLVSEVKGNHNNWLAKDSANIPDEKKDERVIKCPVCGKRHTNYQTNEWNEPGECMINVFTWWDFLRAFKEGSNAIKPWVIFDEAHTDYPPYQKLIAGMREIPTDKRGFEMLEVSATFTNLPSSKKLDGTLADYYVTDFTKVPAISGNPEVFKKKTLVYCDDLTKLDFKPLDNANIKYTILNDAIKDIAKEGVKFLKEPYCLVFANRDYSVGFSFGDVNVISTAVSQRTIITDIRGGKPTKKVVPGKDGISFDDMMQIRGRAARSKDYTAIHMILDKRIGTFIGKLNDDYPGKIVGDYLKKAKSGRPKADSPEAKNLQSIIDFFSQPEALPKELTPKEGALWLGRLLVFSLRRDLNSSNFWSRLKGQFTFQNKLMKHFKPDKMEDLLIETFKDDLISFAKNYEWFTDTPEDETDDLVFDTEEEAKVVGPWLHLMEKYDPSTKKGGYEISMDKSDKDSGAKLILKYKPFKYDKNLIMVK